MAQGAKPGEGGQLPGHKVDQLHRERAADDAGRRPDLAAAAPRHLLDRGSQAADLRPPLRESRRAHLGEARRRGRGRHRRRRRREGERRPRADLGARRRHRRLAALVDPVRGHPVGDRPRRDAADARAQRPALADLGADRRPAEDRARRRRRRAARRRRDGLRDGAADRVRLRDDARLPPEHVPGRDRDAGSRAAQALRRASPSTSSTSSSSSPRRRGEIMARLGVRQVRGSDRPRRPARGRRGDRALEGARHRPLRRCCRRRTSRPARRGPPRAAAGVAARRRARLAADRASSLAAIEHGTPVVAEHRRAERQPHGRRPALARASRRRTAPPGCRRDRSASRCTARPGSRSAPGSRRGSSSRSSATRTTTSARGSRAASWPCGRPTAPRSSPRRT